MGPCLDRSQAHTALLGRLIHHHYIVETGNESYRFRYNSSTDKAPIKLREQAKAQEEIDGLIGQTIRLNHAEGGNLRLPSLVDFQSATTPL